MTETRSYICDHCGSSILEARTLMRVECGPLRLQLKTVDLCHDCSALFANWLADGKGGGLFADLDPPADWPPLAGRSATPRDFAPGAAS